MDSPSSAWSSMSRTRRTLWVFGALVVIGLVITLIVVLTSPTGGGGDNNGGGNECDCNIGSNADVHFLGRAGKLSTAGFLPVSEIVRIPMNETNPNSTVTYGMATGTASGITPSAVGGKTITLSQGTYALKLENWTRDITKFSAASSMGVYKVDNSNHAFNFIWEAGTATKGTAVDIFDVMGTRVQLCLKTDEASGFTSGTIVICKVADEPQNEGVTTFTSTFNGSLVAADKTGWSKLVNDPGLYELKNTSLAANSVAELKEVKTLAGASLATAGTHFTFTPPTESKMSFYALKIVSVSPAVPASPPNTIDIMTGESSVATTVALASLSSSKYTFIRVYAKTSTTNVKIHIRSKYALTALSFNIFPVAFDF